MERKMNKEEFLQSFEEAMETEQLHLFYQPQYNHSTGRMTGAEALMRWKHPEYGMQSPGDFIPVLEENGLIHRADLHGFETLCRFLRRCLDEDVPMIPISFNISRYDIFEHDYVEEIEAIRKRYDIPVKYLRAEITESSAVGGMELVSSLLEQLHARGYLVEMDDFGSGYSSLNVLKDLPVDIIKLDMRFLSGSLGGRGGIILGSIVNMAKWLNTPTIAEGVETMEQADFMQSVGCNYIQGFLYAKPMPGEELIELLRRTGLEPTRPAMELIHTINAEKFWDPASLETLIFSNYVGAAAIFTYEKGRIELLRVNDKYRKEIGMNLTQEDLIRMNPWDSHDVDSRKIYEDTILRAIRSGEEETCETWRTFWSKSCGEDRICVRSSIRAIGRAGEQTIFYAMVQNVTAEKRNYNALLDSERRFRYASEQINAFAWEYHIGTKEMRPCFRCMRDLGLPPLVENYPEPAIEMGIFPPDYADMYRDWHRQLAEGVEHLEAIIPLTPDRVPFHVRYTLERDENGRPLKAYGSAAPVIDEKPEGDSCGLGEVSCEIR